ncbi:N-succinylarginine dihydrolase [Blastopirellula marina]|uniref:N-succinylarginine dihydrolase n=1 Tax=Blastopirellula marina TaxID=124 RepID=A0A2S8G9T2_9BACT|nr:N-succinylarginine dihydrolase [Blastopirellula marina]PQO41187.1 N-succinylarginine dihydrolase [Blastopirellula marina]PTL46063.1 N-succinylarginine dihydrolase [Blastopirellula marina]
MTAQEVNFDGLIGPTHHYGGLSEGNLASQQHRHQVSSPRKAALQGLAKMKQVADLGLVQGFIPPQRRPDLAYLRRQGFTGSPGEIVAAAYRGRPDLLSNAYSASSMWTANAATVSPSADCQDGRVHFTPANLQSMPHRQLEAEQTTARLRKIFHDPTHFVVHDPLPAEAALSDEGAANHTRFCAAYGQPGVELFVYGRDASTLPGQTKFVARQTKSASQQIATQHLLNPARCVFAKQSPQAIDAGVFHNDVIAVGNQSVHLVHAGAFVDQPRVLDQLQSAYGPGLQTIEIEESDLSLDEAVQTYFFNSQLLTLPSGKMRLLCPIECQTSERARQLIEKIVAADNPIDACQFADLRESMQNGGGPACLRLRVVLTDEQLAAVPSGYLLTDQRYEQLCAWVNRHYREHLAIADLADGALLDEANAALDDLDLLLTC